VFCHEASHIQTDECGAPEFFTGGAKLIPLSGEHGKITAEALERAVTPLPAGVVHHVQPKVVSLTQLTECGTVYTPGEVRAIADFAHDNGMAVHMDGSRFANALATLGCTAAEITWQAGVDVLSFGATKNGAMAAEAVIFFDPAKAGDIEFRRKRAGHLWSKSRFLAAQFDAYLADDLWLRLAAHANAMARRLADGLAGIDGVTLIHPVEGNEVFATLPEGMAGRLLAAGARFYPWIYPGDATAGGTIRLMTFFCTRDEDVESFVSLCRKEAP
jgi:threonine aldolase